MLQCIKQQSCTFLSKSSYNPSSIEHTIHRGMITVSQASVVAILLFVAANMLPNQVGWNGANGVTCGMGRVFFITLD